MKIVEYSKGSITEVENVFKVVESGAQGPTGAGLPAGGLINQMIRKTSSAVDFATEWFTIVAATVGLGNVTDDAQLKRSAGDFQAFTQKISPELADSVLGEDSADGENKKRITLDGIKTLFQTAFNLIYAAIFNVLNIGTIVGSTTLNATTASTQTADFTADFTATLAGFTGSRQSVTFEFVVSGGGAPTITLAGSIFKFYTTLTLTSLADGSYVAYFKSSDSGTNTKVFVKLAP